MTNKIIKTSGITIMITAVVVASITGTVLADGSNPDSVNKGEECPYGDCADGECTPNNWDYSYNYAEPGPHGPASITDTLSAVSSNPGLGNQGQERPYGYCADGECTPNNWDYAEPGAKGMQNRSSNQ